MKIRITNNQAVIKVRISRILLTLFVLYCILEILKIAYIVRSEAFFVAIGMFVFGVSIIIGFRKHLTGDRDVSSEPGHLFSTKPTKVIMVLHVASIVLTLLAVIVLLVDFPGFLIVQSLLLANLWLDNRRFNVSLNMLRSSFIFTIIYVSYVLLLTKNTFMGLVALLYLVSWLYLQFKLEQPELQGRASETAECEEPSIEESKPSS